MREKDQYLEDAYDALSRVLASDYDEEEEIEPKVSEFQHYLNVYLEREGKDPEWTEIITANLVRGDLESVFAGLRKIDPDRDRNPRKGEGFYELGV